MNICDRLASGKVTRNAEETRTLASELASVIPVDCTLVLHGDLGVGKTTFVQGLAHGLGIAEPVTSPTYTIYTLHKGKRMLAHVDAYRLDNPKQIEDLLLEEFLKSPWCMAVEWPEKIADWLPANCWHLYLSIRGGRHEIRLNRPEET